jgi:uncharacterized protein YbjQ (UPF0145 family)
MRGVLIALVVSTALPASAQRAASEIALVESAAPAGAIVLGEVRAEIHQTSLFAKTPARDLADRELRAQAAKLGADAVVGVSYESSSPLFSKKGFRAAGKAVKFGPAPVQVAAAAPAPPVAPPQPKVEVAPPAPTPETGRTATFTLAAPSSVTQPAPPVAPIVTMQAPAVLPSPPVVASTPSPSPNVAAPPQVATPPAPRVEAIASPPAVAPPVTQPAPVAAAAAVPAAPRGPTPEALIVLTEEDVAGRAYERLGDVNATARQTSLFPKKSARATMDEQLRSKAAALGADAVILIKYEAYSPLLSKKGASATGVAVKYR